MYKDILCNKANKTEDGKCIGYQKSYFDNEPSKMCRECEQNIFYEESQ